MERFSKTEYMILKLLYEREASPDEEGAPLIERLELREKDEITQIRELVFYVEKLEREGFLITEPGFYTESDHMSFTYLNSAVELDESRIRLSDTGRTVIQNELESGAFTGLQKAWRNSAGQPGTRTLLAMALAAGMMLGFILGVAFGRGI